MRESEWIQFRWKAGKIPSQPVEVPEHFSIGMPEREEVKTAILVTHTSFGLDSEWVHHLKSLKGFLDRRLEEAFDEDPIPCVTLRHGLRIIGTSLLDPAQDADNHLVTGPCVLAEYRSRGLGSLLFKQSLWTLGKLGLKEVRGLTRHRGTAARFIYPKFEGISDPFDFVWPEEP